MNPLLLNAMAWGFPCFFNRHVCHLDASKVNLSLSRLIGYLTSRHILIHAWAPFVARCLFLPFSLDLQRAVFYMRDPSLAVRQLVHVTAKVLCGRGLNYMDLKERTYIHILIQQCAFFPYLLVIWWIRNIETILVSGSCSELLLPWDLFVGSSDIQSSMVPPSFFRPQISYLH